MYLTMEEDGIFSETVDIIRLKLKVLGSLMMGLDGKSVELGTGEIQALGFVIHGISQELKDWNLKDKSAAD